VRPVPLKPCPFCGATDRVIPWESPNWDYSIYMWEVWCKNCSAEGPRKETEAEAIEAWNRRAVPVAEVEAGK
jgi:Lar family restriction alleviation protein